MNQETIMHIKLTAARGMMLTNGKCCGREVFLGTGDSPENWQQVTETEAQAMMEAYDEGEVDDHV